MQPKPESATSIKLFDALPDYKNSLRRSCTLLYYPSVHVVNDLHLDAALGNVGAQSHGLLGLLEGVAVGDELLQVEDAAAEAGNAGRPGVPVAVDEAQVNL